MSNEIKNNPKSIKNTSKKILGLSDINIPKANGTSKDSTGGRVAEYNDKILNALDYDLKIAFNKTFLNSATKFKKIAEDFVVTDKNASV